MKSKLKANRKPTLQEKHKGHRYCIRPVTKPSPHTHEAFCVDCQQHIQWVTAQQYAAFLLKNQVQSRFQPKQKLKRTK